MLGEMKDPAKGEAKIQVAQFTTSDYEARRVIMKGLIEAGYDVITKPIQRPGTLEIIGEEITVYRKEVI